MKKNLLFYSFAMTALAMSACSSAMTSAKMAQIQPGMNAAQVEALLGRPAHIDQSETTGLRGEVYEYRGANDGQGRVIFLNDAVFKADFVPGGKTS